MVSLIKAVTSTALVLLNQPLNVLICFVRFLSMMVKLWSMYKNMLRCKCLTVTTNFSMMLLYLFQNVPLLHINSCRK